MEAIKLKLKVNSSFVRLDTDLALQGNKLVRHKKEQTKKW